MKKKIAVTASGSNGSSNLPLALIFNNLHQLDEGIRKMERGVFYKFKDISGDDYWDCLTEKEKLRSYLCVEFLIKHEELPLTVAGYLANEGFVYRLA